MAVVIDNRFPSGAARGRVTGLLERAYPPGRARRAVVAAAVGAAHVAVLCGAMKVHSIVHDEPTSARVTLVNVVPRSLASPIPTAPPPPPARAHLLFDAPVVPGIPNVVAAPVPNSVEGGAPTAAVVAASQEAAVTLAGELAVYCPERRPPAYPMASRQRREQGEAVLKVELAEDGAITSVEVSASSGSPRLDAAARTAVLGWHCRPPRQGEHAVRAVAIQPIEFVLNRR